MKFFKIIDRNDGWSELCFDTPDNKANVFTADALAELGQIVDQLKDRRELKGLLVTSAKSDIFIAGADIKLIQTLDTLDKALEGATTGQQIIHRFSKLPFQKVAAIGGACLGGGFELALACDKRIASDSKGVKIGLPEVNLGILPGFGGSVRLPRLTKLSIALDMILSGKQLDGGRALKSGCVEAVLPKEDFNERALAWAKSNVNKKPGRIKKGLVDKFQESGLGRMIVFKTVRKAVWSKTKGQYPAAMKIIELLEHIYKMELEEALRTEARFFAQLAITPVSKRCIEIFLLTEGVKKTNGVGDSVKAAKVERAAVLGAGVMGGGIAWAFANKEIPIRMKDLNHEAIGLGYQQAAESFGHSLKTRKITKNQFMGKMAQISGGLDFSGFKAMDVVVEAVVENMDVKKKVLLECEKHVSPDFLIPAHFRSRNCKV
jgi:3-hydroxyacyl-CoA dehydrogenase/enoyl-CoA hydratase/3-hydroxybutyryl-CoA epimerase